MDVMIWIHEPPGRDTLSGAIVIDREASQTLDGFDIISTLPPAVTVRIAPVPSLLRRLFAAGGAAVVLLLAILAASPALHAWIHADSHAESDDCAVVLFASGVTLAATAIAISLPPREWAVVQPVEARDFFPAAPRYLRQPERGPPAV
jgi:hypothetical protein